MYLTLLKDLNRKLVKYDFMVDDFFFHRSIKSLKKLKMSKIGACIASFVLYSDT